MIHVGLDLSLTSTGIAVLEPGAVPRLGIVTSKPTGATLRTRRDRVLTIVEQINALVFPPNGVPKMAPDTEQVRVYVEAPTYATNSGSQHDRSGLWWAVVSDYLTWTQVIEVSPTTVKAFATGRGNASKPEMMAATAQQFPGVEFRSDDDSDALWIAELSEYVENPDAGRVARTKYRDKAASAVPRA